MTRSSLASSLEKIRDFLQSDAAFLLSVRVREDYLERSVRLLEKAQQPGEVLYVGIVGGTGVGKSTLINALANAKISDVSDKRPQTNRAVVYRHTDTPRGLEEISDMFRETDSVHQIDTIRNLLLLDLPDFDSFEEHNRKTVLRILPKLDSIVWVVSPEKYADAAFYRLVGQTTVHQENFTFILNKVDELLGHDKDTALHRVKEVIGDLTLRLKNEGGISQPRVFSISASEVLDGHPETEITGSEFRRFRDFLMVRREAKDVASVKTKNLIEESVGLLKELDAEIQPDSKKKILDLLRQMQTENNGNEDQTVPGALPQEHDLTSIVSQMFVVKDSSIGPVKWIMKRLARAFSFKERANRDAMENVFGSAAQTLVKDRLPEMEKMEALIDAELLLAFGPTEAGLNKQKPDQILAAAMSQAFKKFCRAIEVRMQTMGGVRSRFRRAWQKLCLFVPLLMLMLKLAGLQRIEAWCEVPSLGGLVSILLSLATALFSSEGLIGLAVLSILEILLIYQLAARRMRKIERQSKMLARTAITNLRAQLDLVAKRIREDGRRTLNHIQAGLNVLEDLKKTFRQGIALIPESSAPTVQFSPGHDMG